MDNNLIVVDTDPDNNELLNIPSLDIHKVEEILQQLIIGKHVDSVYSFDIYIPQNDLSYINNINELTSKLKEFPLHIIDGKHRVIALSYLFHHSNPIKGKITINIAANT